MGTLRWEKDQAVFAARDKAQIAARQKQATLRTEEALLEVRLKAVQLELQEKRLEKQNLSRTATDLKVELASGKTHMGELRGADKK
jgi:hypothetical protein